jgi:glycosyltransferase involved in cell wall biosynthesis
MLNNKMNHIVVHLSSVHNVFDPRIFYKECKSLAEYGYNIHLVIPFEKSEEAKLEGIYIVPLRKPNSRIDRIIKSINQVRKVALAINSDLYHFHDPELIPVGLFLKTKGKKVIYDIHEDYLTSIQQKKYLGVFRFPISWLFFIFEKISSNFFELVLAEKYYLNRYPKGTVICNYPILSKIKQNIEIIKKDNSKENSNLIKLIYTGNVTEDRGAFIHSSIINLIKNVKLYFIGRCKTEIAEKIRAIAGTGSDSINIVGENSYVDYNEILEFYRSYNWTAAIAIFPSTPHYKQKELTKLFEYMAFGLPIICSNFPVWKKLVEDNGAGLSVDPESQDSIIQAITYIKEHPDEAKQMGNRGKKLIEEQYNWENESKKLIQLYENLIKSG